MTNTTNTKRKPGNPNFVQGNTWGKLGGRPCKHDIIKYLEDLRDEANSLPLVILEAVAFIKTAQLAELQIPLKQVSRRAIITARGLLHERIKHDNL